MTSIGSLQSKAIFSKNLTKLDGHVFNFMTFFSLFPHVTLIVGFATITRKNIQEQDWKKVFLFALEDFTNKI